MRSPLRRAIRPTRTLWPNRKPLPPASDLRIRGGHTGRCILCGRRRVLRLGHVVPKWAYRWHKKSWGGWVRGRYLSLGIEDREQDSNKHYLMCEQCEQFVGRGDEYFRLVVAGDFKERLSRRLLVFKSWFLGLNIRLLRRFVLGTALRCHYAVSPPFHDLRLPALFVRRIRRELIRPTLSQETPILAATIFRPPEGDPVHDPRCDVFSGYEDNLHLGPIYYILVAGWEWYLFFDRSHPFSARVPELAPKRLLRLPIASYGEHRNVSRIDELVAYYEERRGSN